MAYLERLRSRRLHEAGVCVQRHVRGWIQRKRYRQFRTATVLVQTHARGLLARRYVCMGAGMLRGDRCWTDRFITS